MGLERAGPCVGLVANLASIDPIVRLTASAAATARATSAARAAVTARNAYSTATVTRRVRVALQV
jgi:hypothetical protein